MKRFISALCSAIIAGTSLISPANAVAEETTDIVPVYEFPVIGEVYIYEGQNYHLGDYTEMNIKVQVFIEPDGNTKFLFLADDDFEYESDKNYTVTIDNRTRLNEHTIAISAPNWYAIPSYTRCKDAYWFQNTAKGSFSQQDTYIYDEENNRTLIGRDTCSFYDKNPKTNKGVPFNYQFTEQPYTIKTGYTASGKTIIKTGDLLGLAYINFDHNTIYVSEDQKQFIVQNGEKQYIDDDMFITFTIDGTSITKEIGLHYYDSPAIIYSQGDVNDDSEFNITDVVLLQKWLLSVPNTNLAKWPAADMNHDSRLDVFDLCLMKRALINATE